MLPISKMAYQKVFHHLSIEHDKVLLGKMLESIVNNPYFEWLRIDASHIKAHPQVAGECCAVG